MGIAIAVVNDGLFLNALFGDRQRGFLAGVVVLLRRVALYGEAS